MAKSAPKRREIRFERVESRYKRFDRSYRSMNPSNFSDTPNFKFLKSRQFKKNPGGGGGGYAVRFVWEEWQDSKSIELDRTLTPDFAVT